jgi:hypothetical protein
VVRVFDLVDGIEYERAVHRWPHWVNWAGIYRWLWTQHGKTDLWWQVSFCGRDFSTGTTFMKFSY